ncbi:MAG: hypothetical protein ACRDWN_00720 [Acidimicrobiales bacterium]
MSSFGDAGFYGSEGGQHLNAPVVGTAAGLRQCRSPATTRR